MEDKEILQRFYSLSDEKKIEILKRVLSDELTIKENCEGEKLSFHSLKKYISENVKSPTYFDVMHPTYHSSRVYAVFTDSNTFFIEIPTFLAEKKLDIPFNDLIYFKKENSDNFIVADVQDYSKDFIIQSSYKEAYSTLLTNLVPSNFMYEDGMFDKNAIQVIYCKVNEYLAMHPTFYEEVFGNLVANFEESKGKAFQKTTNN